MRPLPRLIGAAHLASRAVYGVKGCPFVLLTLTLPPRDVDINMNPAKETVGLMHETEVVALIKRRVEHELKARALLHFLFTIESVPYRPQVTD